MAVRQSGRQEEKGREKERCEEAEIGRDSGRKEGTGERDAVTQKRHHSALKKWLFSSSLRTQPLLSNVAPVAFR